MYFVTKSFHIPIAHRLSKHCGNCKNLHGHNFKLEVTVKTKDLNSNDMVIDFSDLKKIVNEIIDSWDHGLFLNVCDSNEFIGESKKHILDCDPTSETLSKILFDEIELKLPSNVFLHKITLWEAEDSKSTYKKYEN